MTSRAAIGALAFAILRRMASPGRRPPGGDDPPRPIFADDFDGPGLDRAKRSRSTAPGRSTTPST